MEKDNQFFTTYEETENWLLAMDIGNYTINNDLTVDIKGTVNIRNNNLICLPVQFGNVEEDFVCSYNKLSTLKGCPMCVGKNFWCNQNHLNFQMTGEIILSPIKSVNYLDNYKHKDGYIYIDFNELKKLQALQKLNEKLNDDLPINTNITKKMKV